MFISLLPYSSFHLAPPNASSSFNFSMAQSLTPILPSHPSSASPSPHSRLPAPPCTSPLPPLPSAAFQISALECPQPAPPPPPMARRCLCSALPLFLPSAVTQSLPLPPLHLTWSTSPRLPLSLPLSLPICEPQQPCRSPSQFLPISFWSSLSLFLPLPV